MAPYNVKQTGESLSFPKGDAFFGAAAVDAAPVSIFIGQTYVADATKIAILIELGEESLAEHVGDDCADTNVLGFARFRNGRDAPSSLVEIVRLPSTSDAALQAAKAVFEEAGLQAVVCTDQIGRIVNRLVVPKYNAALRFLDEGLATQSDMDLTCKLGLGYPDGPIERVLRGGLPEHHVVCQALFEVYGTPSYAPPRRAIVASRAAVAR